MVRILLARCPIVHCRGILYQCTKWMRRMGAPICCHIFTVSCISLNKKNCSLNPCEKVCCLDTMSAAQAVEALIYEYEKLVFHTIYALTGDWEESQDLTQDTFLQALRGIDAARAASGAQFHAKAWLLRIALNTVRMQRRRRKLFRFIPFSHMLESGQQEQAETLHEQAAPVQPSGFGVGQEADPTELVAERDALQRTLCKLSEPLRVCLLLSIIGGLSTAEIATILNLKDAAVRQRIARAKKQFEQLYANESGEKVCDAPEPHAQHIDKDDAEQQTGWQKQRLQLAILPP